MTQELTGNDGHVYINHGRMSSVLIKGLEAEFLRTHDVNFLDKPLEFRVVRGYSYDEANQILMYIAVLQYTDTNCYAMCGDVQPCVEENKECTGENDVYVVNDDSGEIEAYSSINNVAAMAIIDEFKNDLSAVAYADFQRILGYSVNETEEAEG